MMEERAEVLGKQLYKLRTEKGLSMQELADAIGVNKSTVFKWEHGRTSLEGASVKHTKELARVLGVSPALLRGEKEHAPVRINSQDYVLTDGKTVVHVERKPAPQTNNDRLLLYALDILMMQNGFRTDYTPDGDVLLIRGDVAKPVTEAELLAMAQDISQLAGGQLRRLFGGGS